MNLQCSMISVVVIYTALWSKLSNPVVKILFIYEHYFISPVFFLCFQGELLWEECSCDRPVSPDSAGDEPLMSLRRNAEEHYSARAPWRQRTEIFLQTKRNVIA